MTINDNVSFAKISNTDINGHVFFRTSWNKKDGHVDHLEPT